MMGEISLRWKGPAILSGILLVLAQPPFHVPALSFLALAPLAAMLGSLPSGRGGSLRAAQSGILFGVIFWGAELIWVPLTVGTQFSWAYPGYALLLVLLGGLSGLMAWTVHRLNRSAGVPLVLAFPLGWVAVEWTKAHFPMGLAFPWLGLGVTLTRWPHLLGIAEWVGESGVAFWLAAVNGLLATWILAKQGETGDSASDRRARSRAFPWRGGGRFAGAFFLTLPFLMGPILGRRLVATEGPRILVVGTDVGSAIRADPAAGARASLAQARARVTPSRQEAWDLVVVPEAFFPLVFAPGANERGRAALLDWQHQLAVPLMFGAQGKGAGDRVANSVFLLQGSGGETQRYDKSKLVPGMELGAYEAGSGPMVLGAAGWNYGPLLCYESLFGGLARSQRKAGAQVLVNLSNDVWFGSHGGLLGSLFLRQHPAHLVLRAVENRLPVVRAANGGYSFLMDSRGRIVSDRISPLGGLTEGLVSVPDRTTLFTRFGDLVGPGTVFVGLLLVLTGLANRTRPALDMADGHRHPPA